MITVLRSNNPPVLDVISNQTLALGMTLTLTNAAHDSDSPPQTLTFAFAQEPPTNASVDSASGIFQWTPNETQLGTNAFTVSVTDNGSPPLSVTQSFIVVVVASNRPPTLAAITDQTIYALTMLTLTNSASDPDSGQILAFSLDPGAPLGAAIDPATGVFGWTPGDGQAGTNTITVRVTDNGTPAFSDAKAFNVTVLPRPVGSITVSNGIIVFSWTAFSGTSYRAQFKTNLADVGWSDVIPDVVAAGSKASISDNPGPRATIFYRVMVVQ
jgi:hypothetical protein